MHPDLITRHRALVARGELTDDAAQALAVQRLQRLADQLRQSRRRSLWNFRMRPAPKGVYLWGDVGRGKSLLMDLFYESTDVTRKRRIHFNAFMVETHARIDRERRRGADPIPGLAQRIATEAKLLCFDEFQVTDVADAMILGRVFEQLFDLGVVVVATSNTQPERLYKGGLNRQLFLPFIALIEQKLDIIELSGSTDYRLQYLAQLDTYIVPIGAEADAKMDAAWLRLTNMPRGARQTLDVLGRKLTVPQATKGVARFSFNEVCREPLAAADYLALAQRFHTILLDSIPALSPAERNEARRFILLVDTLYDNNVKLVCSAAALPDRLYPKGDGANAFRRTASRLVEMQSMDYLQRGHGLRGFQLESVTAPA